MVETLIVAALVLWSALVVFKKVFPQTSNAFKKLSNLTAFKRLTQKYPEKVKTKKAIKTAKC